MSDMSLGGQIQTLLYLNTRDKKFQNQPHLGEVKEVQTTRNSPQCGLYNGVAVVVTLYQRMHHPGISGGGDLTPKFLGGFTNFFMHVYTLPHPWTFDFTLHPYRRGAQEDQQNF